MDTRTFARSREQAPRENRAVRYQIALAALKLAQMAVALVADDTPSASDDNPTAERHTARTPAPFERFDLELDLTEPLGT